MLLLSGKLSGVHKLGENFREGTSRISKSSGKKDIGNSSKMLATLSFAQNQCLAKGYYRYMCQGLDIVLRFGRFYYSVRSYNIGCYYRGLA